jgi:hypothetical protein
VTNAKVADFKPATRNANKHTARGLGTIDKSMRTDGYGDPMLAAADGEMISGSARLETVAQVFGVEVEPIIVHSDGTRPIIHVRDDIPNAADKRAVRLALAANRAAELDLSWDVAVLAGLDADVLDGLWTADELSDLGQQWADEHKAAQDDPGAQIDKAEELQAKWHVKPGDLWQLGAHRLICGDCTDAATVARVMGGEKAALVIADPPYGLDIVSANGYVGGGEGPQGMIPFGGVKNGKRLGSSHGAKPFGSQAVRGPDGAAHVVGVGKYMPIVGDDTPETAIKAATFYLALFPQAAQFWWGGNYYANKLPPSPCWVVWDKETTGNFADCELAWSNLERSAKLFRHQWNGMLRDSERERRMHPSQKPAALASFLMAEFGKPGDIVIDPFAGAGWVVIAAEQSGFKARAIEIVSEYCAVILQRYADMTGQTPVLVSDGQQ